MRPMTSKPKAGELIAVRTLREQQWAYARRLEHLSYRAMRSAANLPTNEGGLGYDISEQGLKGLVAGYVAEQHEVLAADRDELLARQQADLDELARHARTALGKATKYGVLDKDAALLLRGVLEDERKLHGLAAPTEARIDVTVSDATDKAIAELAVDLERMAKR